MQDTVEDGGCFRSDRDVLDRIVGATNLPLPADWDWEAFRSDLNACYACWCLLSDVGPKRAKKGIERLTRYIGWAAEGVRLAKEDDADLGHVAMLWAEHGGGFPPLLPQMERLVRVLEGVNLEHEEYEDSPLETLTGVLLPYVFRRQFKRPPRVSRDPGTGKPGGPYIRFTEQVCAAFGIKCSAETIASAMRRCNRADPVDN
jgi:hypothetical protein